MNKKKLFVTFAVVSVICLAQYGGVAFGGWLIYHKPALEGKVIDADTKEPIEGAVVVVIYYKAPLLTGPAGGSSSIVKIKETLTDKKGEFRFPSYTTVIQPFAIESELDFIIYKAGYGSYPGIRTGLSALVSLEEFFSRELGTTGERWVRGRLKSFEYGVVELPKIKTQGGEAKGHSWTDLGMLIRGIAAAI